MTEALGLARRLLLGPLTGADATRLDDPELRAAVAARLRRVGQRAVRTSAGWIALSNEPVEPDQACGEPHLALGGLERALAAWLYLHLVFLPYEDQSSPLAAAPEVSVDELERWARERGLRATEVDPALGRLTRGSFVRRQDRTLRPGPALLAVHDPELQESCATQLMRERLRRWAPSGVAANAEVG